MVLFRCIGLSLHASVHSHCLLCLPPARHRSFNLGTVVRCGSIATLVRN
uniref:Uncharacterized protein n=1 Tax=Anopheles atroparvus TaxID=41427 RepID=A0AAG5DV82_ANOAO